jgi:hypothetical protein
MSSSGLADYGVRESRDKTTPGARHESATSKGGPAAVEASHLSITLHLSRSRYGTLMGRCQYVSISFPLLRFAEILSPCHWAFVPAPWVGLFWR